MSRPDEQAPKRAVIMGRDAAGQARVVGIVEGAEAEAVIAKAQASGVEVRKDAAQIDRLLSQGGEATGAPESRVPAEIYELMATIIGFAQELNEQWIQVPSGFEGSSPE